MRAKSRKYLLYRLKIKLRNRLIKDKDNYIDREKEWVNYKERGREQRPARPPRPPRGVDERRAKAEVLWSGARAAPASLHALLAGAKRDGQHEGALLCVASRPSQRIIPRESYTHQIWSSLRCSLGSPTPQVATRNLSGVLVMLSRSSSRSAIKVVQGRCPMCSGPSELVRAWIRRRSLTFQLLLLGRRRVQHIWAILNDYLLCFFPFFLSVCMCVGGGQICISVNNWEQFLW